GDAPKWASRHGPEHFVGSRATSASKLVARGDRRAERSGPERPEPGAQPCARRGSEAWSRRSRGAAPRAAWAMLDNDASPGGSRAMCGLIGIAAAYAPGARADLSPLGQALERLRSWDAEGKAAEQELAQAASLAEDAALASLV